MINDASHNASTIAELIAAHPARAIAIVAPDFGLRVSYGTLREHINFLAGALLAAGVPRDARIAVAQPNGYSSIASILAASSIGSAIPLHRPDDDAGFSASLDESAATAVILPADSPDSIQRTAAACGRTFTIAVDRGGEVSLQSVPPRSAREEIRPRSDPLVRQSEDVAIVLSTRGTGGRRRRVGLSHANLSTAAKHVAATLALRPDDVSLCVMPVTEVQGLVTATLASLTAGGTVVMPAGFHPLSFWRVARDHGVTWYSAAPQLHQWLLARTADPGARRPAGASNLRFIRASGAVLPEIVRQTLESAFGAPVIEAYEVTEASGEVASNAADHLRPRQPAPPSLPGPTSVPAAATSVPGAVGPATSARIAIIDPAGHPLPPGSRGQVAVAGPTLAQQYEHDEDATSRFFVDGWFRTGDLGYLDARGYLTLLGVRVEGSA